MKSLKWIDCKVKLPEKGEKVGYAFSGLHIYDSLNGVDYDHEKKRWFYVMPGFKRYEFIEMTHWIPYPEEPNYEKKKSDVKHL
jgi:hypothetical protein